MSRLYLRRGEVASSHAVSTWQSVMFSEFEAQMSSEARPFPCVFGVAGYRQDQLRYLFLDPFDVEQALLEDLIARVEEPFLALRVGRADGPVERREEDDAGSRRGAQVSHGDSLRGVRRGAVTFRSGPGGLA